MTTISGETSLLARPRESSGKSADQGKLRHDPPPSPSGAREVGRRFILVFGFDGAEFQKDIDPVPDALRGRAVDEGESVDIAQIEGEHPQDDARPELERRISGGCKGGGRG